MSNPAFLEQVLNVIHAVDVCHLQQFTDFCSTGVFFRASILSGHIFFLHPDASILHLSGGLHNYWDGLLFFFIFWKIVQLSILRNQLDILCIQFRCVCYNLCQSSQSVHLHNFIPNSYLFFSNIPLNFAINTAVVTAAATRFVELFCAMIFSVLFYFYL